MSYSNCNKSQFQRGAVQKKVQAFFLHQFIMIALFNYQALVQDDNFIRSFYSGQTMRDSKWGPALHDGTQIFLNGSFWFIIQCAGGFIENKDPGVSD